MRKWIVLFLGLIVLSVVVCWIVLEDRIQRVRMAASLFTGVEQVHNFPRLHEMFPTAELPAASSPWRFPRATTRPLPLAFDYREGPVDVQTFLEETDTAALLVLDEGSIVFEEYWLTGGIDVTWLSMSVAKSFISALVGIALNEGAFESVDVPVSDLVPSLVGSAYEYVAIRDILQMSSGARWNEDYSDPQSDINRFGRIFALGGSINEFAASLTNELPPGTFNRYNSTDTQVLGMLLVETTGQSITEYMRDKLWLPLGAESHAYWLLDGEGMEMAFGGLNATARDYAKLGELYRLGGAREGVQIVPEAWIEASLRTDAAHLVAGENPASDNELGYGYQWWIPEGDRGEFLAIGVYNQFVYVDPTAGVVITKLSANSDYGTTTDESSYREFETIELFRAITRSVSQARPGDEPEAVGAEAPGEPGEGEPVSDRPGI